MQDLSHVTAISASGGSSNAGGHSLALLSSGGVMAWGSNGNGELGVAPSSNSPLPVAVTGLNGVSGLAAGTYDNLVYGAGL
ncbi:MAG TPA: RCC1 domain-containing protein [Solirubrobacteraceae bacterium]|nr:RCC1 domain-containing protein [Solirubrobacteraceae bacterium]